MNKNEQNILVRTCLLRHIVVCVCVVALATGCGKKPSGERSEADQSTKAQNKGQPSDIFVPESSEAAMKFSSTITSTTPSGEKVVFQAEELVRAKSGLLSDSLAKGRGQVLHTKGGKLLLLTTETVASLEPRRLSVTLFGKKWDFVINDKTRFCDSSMKPIAAGTIKPGDSVTVVSLAENPLVALSVRKGEMLLQLGGPTEAAVPVNFDCE